MSDESEKNEAEEGLSKSEGAYKLSDFASADLAASHEALKAQSFASLAGLSKDLNESVRSATGPYWKGFSGHDLSGATGEALKRLRMIAEGGSLNSTLKHPVRLHDFAKLSEAMNKEAALSQNSLRLQEEIRDLKTRAKDQAEEVSIYKGSSAELEGKVAELKRTFEEIYEKQAVQHLRDSVSDRAHSEITIGSDLYDRFNSEEEVEAIVVSVDIRRSTELMLKARAPKLFADFITTFCSKLEAIFKDKWGVVDKFTGDGILVYFPYFYSGEDACYLALKASEEAHELFKLHYKEHRRSFNTVLKDVGLGIGIDYGKVHQVQMAGSLTIVGQPVVYACRMGGAPAGTTLLNQPAYEIVDEKYSTVISTSESSLNIKSEGELIAYAVSLKSSPHVLEEPTWYSAKEDSSSLAKP